MALTWEHEGVVVGLAEFAPPVAEQGDGVGGEVDVASACERLRGGEVSAAVAASYAEDCVAERDVRPAGSDELALACAGLEGDFEEDAEETVGYFLEESR